MRILIFALGEKGLSVVKALAGLNSAHFIHCVIGQDDAVDDDRSAKLTAFCEQHRIEHSSRKDAIHDDYDLFLAVGWRWIIRDIPYEKLIIFHDALLPRYRGFAPLVNALINKETKVGVTALKGAGEYDKGNILLQKSIDIVYPTNIANEIQRISIIYANLAVELITKFESEQFNKEGIPQDEKEATYSLWRDENDYRIDWDDDATNIEHFISCVGQPYRGASAMLNGATVRVVRARAREDVKIENRTPGKVIFIEASLPIVVCGHGLLELVEVRDGNGNSVLPLKNFRSRFY